MSIADSLNTETGGDPHVPCVPWSAGPCTNWDERGHRQVDRWLAVIKGSTYGPNGQKWAEHGSILNVEAIGFASGYGR